MLKRHWLTTYLLLILALLVLVACERPTGEKGAQPNEVVATVEVEEGLIAQKNQVVEAESTVYTGVLHRVWPIPESGDGPDGVGYINVSFTPFGTDQEFCIVPSVAQYDTLISYFNAKTSVIIEATTLDTATGDSASCQSIREVIPGIENYKTILVASSITPSQTQ